MKIMLPVDGSAFSIAAVEEVAARPWPVGSEIEVVTAFQVPITPTPEVWTISDEYYETLEQSAKEKAQATVDAALTLLEHRIQSSVTVSGKVLSGPPREAILEEAEKWNADLIVMGSHGYGAWQRLLLGSVSQAVVLHANCSVEVVHRRKSENDVKAA